MNSNLNKSESLPNFNNYFNRNNTIDKIILDENDSQNFSKINFNYSTRLNNEEIEKKKYKFSFSLINENNNGINYLYKFNRAKIFDNNNINKRNLSPELNFKKINCDINNKNENKIKNIKMERIEKFMKEIRPKIPDYKEFYNKYKDSDSSKNFNDINKKSFYSISLDIHIIFF